MGKYLSDEDIEKANYNIKLVRYSAYGLGIFSFLLGICVGLMF